MFEIIYIMSAKNFNKKQAELFLKHYESINKSATLIENITLDEFIEKTGGVSPIIIHKILKEINELQAA